MVYVEEWEENGEQQELETADRKSEERKHKEKDDGNHGHHRP